MKEASGVGARVPRREDERFMLGQGEYIADIVLPGCMDVAFVRSPLAHATINAIGKPADADGHVITGADMGQVKAIHAPSGLPGFKLSDQPVLATEKVRFVGELLAACLGQSRALAEDLADQVTLELTELGVVSDTVRARDPNAPLLHEHWGDNVFLESSFESPVAATAPPPVSVTRTLRTARQCMAPIEGRGIAAYFDRRLDMLVVYSATQMPHIVRNGLSDCLGLGQSQIRVISPDVGGGFGYKGILTPEEVCVSWLALQRDHPVRWIEDRREQLTANANCREHHYVITAHANEDGQLLGIECEAHVDAGAYSAYPFSACLEAAQVASILPGPYVFDGYQCRTWSVASNKPPILPYRGVARTGVCFALEVLLDALARKLHISPVELRRKNLVRPEQMPFDNVTNKHFDSGNYPECLDRTAAKTEARFVRMRQENTDPNTYIGRGYAVFCEQAAHGTSVYAAWGVPMIPGHEQATARLTADGGLELRVGVHSHGQGLETTLAQVAHEILGIDIDAVKLVHGDTAYTPYSTGTWGSRCMVMAGGAVASACETLAVRIASLGAHLLQSSADDVTLKNGMVVGQHGQVPLSDIGKLWYLQPQHLPDDAAPEGLEVTQGYKTERDSGTFSYACHGCVVAVDGETGAVELLDYVVVEDGGTLVNPMIVEGQVFGGTAQGIGTALYEEMPFDNAGQPLAATLADYHLPGACEVPNIEIEHMETPSPYTRFGQKGLGEGGAIGPPAAIANAINDALAPLGVEVDATPISQSHILEKLIAAANGARS